MAFRLKLVPDHTNIDFFRWQSLTFGISLFAAVASIVLMFTMGLNFGIDFKGGITIRAETTQPLDIGTYRSALTPLDLPDLVITEIYDPTFGPDKHVAQIRIGVEPDQAIVPPETVAAAEAALKAVDSAVVFGATDSVGPKVSGELITSAITAVIAALIAIAAYIWMRFEWQFALGAGISLLHDVLITLGVFALFQLKFDLTTVAAILTIVGYSINDTVVVFDRLRENLVKYKTMPLRDVMNLAVNETLSRTVMTSGTTLIALIALLIFGGDVIRGFVFAITIGIIVGTYSSVYVAKNIVLWLGVKRNWAKPDPKDPDQKNGAKPDSKQGETPFADLP